MKQTLGISSKTKRNKGCVPSKKELLSQNFLKDRDLVVSLIRRSSIADPDTVLEIGPGEGAITDELVKTAGKIIAVERDNELYQELQNRYPDNPRMELYNIDILDFSLPSTPYKVFSNIPFAIEGRLVRKLIDDPQNPPDDAYLVMRREVAQRLAGIPKEGIFSIQHRPWFDLGIFYNFRRSDFQPKPKVESSMLRFTKREVPLVNDRFKTLYCHFIQQGFGGGRRLRQNLKGFFSEKQLRKLALDLKFEVDNKPSDLVFDQWLDLFSCFLKIRGGHRP